VSHSAFLLACYDEESETFQSICKVGTVRLRLNDGAPLPAPLLGGRSQPERSAPLHPPNTRAQGFSEQALKDFAESLTPTSIPAPPPYYIVGEGPNVTPEVWFNPTQVWEVKAADLSISPVHRAAAGLVDPSKGIALRFPRLLRVRDDKKPEDATSATQVRRVLCCHLRAVCIVSRVAFCRSFFLDTRRPGPPARRSRSFTATRRSTMCTARPTTTTWSEAAPVRAHA
jgi:hypothetical protein